MLIPINQKKDRTIDSLIQKVNQFRDHLIECEKISSEIVSDSLAIRSEDHQIENKLLCLKKNEHDFSEKTKKRILNAMEKRNQGSEKLYYGIKLASRYLTWFYYTDEETEYELTDIKVMLSSYKTLVEAHSKNESKKDFSDISSFGIPILCELLDDLENSILKSKFKKQYHLQLSAIEEIRKNIASIMKERLTKNNIPKPFCVPDEEVIFYVDFINKNPDFFIKNRSNFIFDFLKNRFEEKKELKTDIVIDHEIKNIEIRKKMLIEEKRKIDSLESTIMILDKKIKKMKIDFEAYKKSTIFYKIVVVFFGGDSEQKRKNKIEENEKILKKTVADKKSASDLFQNQKNIVDQDISFLSEKYLDFVENYVDSVGSVKKIKNFMISNNQNNEKIIKYLDYRNKFLDMVVHQNTYSDFHSVMRHMSDYQYHYSDSAKRLFNFLFEKNTNMPYQSILDDITFLTDGNIKWRNQVLFEIKKRYIYPFVDSHIKNKTFLNFSTSEMKTFLSFFSNEECDLFFSKINDQLEEEKWEEIPDDFFSKLSVFSNANKYHTIKFDIKKKYNTYLLGRLNSFLLNSQNGSIDTTLKEFSDFINKNHHSESFLAMIKNKIEDCIVLSKTQPANPVHAWFISQFGSKKQKELLYLNWIKNFFNQFGENGFSLSSHEKELRKLSPSDLKKHIGKDNYKTLQKEIVKFFQRIDDTLFIPTIRYEKNSNAVLISRDQIDYLISILGGSCLENLITAFSEHPQQWIKKVHFLVSRWVCQRDLNVLTKEHCDLLSCSLTNDIDDHYLLHIASVQTILLQRPKDRKNEWIGRFSINQLMKNASTEKIDLERSRSLVGLFDFDYEKNPEVFFTHFRLPMLQFLDTQIDESYQNGSADTVISNIKKILPVLSMINDSHINPIINALHLSTSLASYECEAIRYALLHLDEKDYFNAILKWLEKNKIGNTVKNNYFSAIEKIIQSHLLFKKIMIKINKDPQSLSVNQNGSGLSLFFMNKYPSIKNQLAKCSAPGIMFNS